MSAGHKSVLTEIVRDGRIFYLESAMASAKQIKKKRREESHSFAEVSGYRTGHQQAPPGETQMLVACQLELL